MGHLGLFAVMKHFVDGYQLVSDDGVDEGVQDGDEPFVGVEQGDERDEDGGMVNKTTVVQREGVCQQVSALRQGAVRGHWGGELDGLV